MYAGAHGLGGGTHLRVGNLFGGEVVTHYSLPGLKRDSGSKAALTDLVSAASAGGCGANRPSWPRLSALARSSMAWPLMDAAMARMRAASDAGAATHNMPPAQSPSQCLALISLATCGASDGATNTRQTSPAISANLSPQ